VAQNKLQKTTATVTQNTLEIYQGLIPSPDMMAKYKDIDPSLPLRIVQWTEDEGIHRRKIETKIARDAHATTIWGNVLGFLSVIVISALCFLFMINGHAREGMWIACTIIVALAIVFVLRKVPPINQPK